jgi:hexosaminidase
MTMLRLFAFALIAMLSNVALAARPALIPMPVSVEWQSGALQLTTTTIVEGDGAAAPTAAYLAQILGLKAGAKGKIRLRLVPATADLANPEAYRLRVTAKAATITASDPKGLFYGAQTLRQLVTQSAGRRAIAAAEIADAPRFPWRGLLIDVSRHFFGKAVMLRYIDEMARYKLNVLHLHLTDDPGWRLEIPGYPKLTEVGALDPATGQRQYFTAADIREIVAYAAERHIIVVPEIEMPGHAGSEARSYPEFFDKEGRFNPGKPETYAFIQAVLGEVAKLFPGPFLHFGGDEVGEGAWKDLPEVNRLKREQGLATSGDVEKYFGRRVAEIIKGLGKRPMAWDEQAEAGADKSVVIMWWRKGRPDVLSAAAKSGYDLIMAPVDYTYFDYPQALGEPGAPWEGNDNGPTSIAKILSWEPVPDSFSPAEARHVLGVEAAVWTEFIASERYLEFMTFPRLLAFSEIAWSPKAKRDEAEFNIRLGPHLEGLRARGINARREQGDAFEFMTT